MANEKRLIDAERLKRILQGFEGKLLEAGKTEGAETVKTIIKGLKTQPTVDAVEVVRGEWVGTQYDGYADGCPVYDLWECSNCREEYESEGDPPDFNYCPNCGAKMDGDGNA